MNRLIEEIKNHQTSNNESICEQLIDIIEYYNITSKEELLEHENKFFVDTDLSKKIDAKYKEYLLDVTRFDDADNSDLNNISEYEKLMNNSNNDLDKCKYLILIYDYVGYGLYFPYEAYLLMLDDNMK